MPAHKPGLHKDVSTIFDGVPVPGKDAQRGPGEPSWQRAEPASPKHGAPDRLTPAALKVRLGARPPAKTDDVVQEKVYSETRLGPAPRQRQTWQRIRKKLFAPKAGVSAKRQKTMALLVPILSIALILVFIRVFGVPSFKTDRTVTTTEGPTTGSAVDSGHKIDWQVPAAYPATLRDPMKLNLQQASEAKVEVVELNVKGIVYAEDRPSAIIGTEIVHEGDTVSGATVVRIGPGSIEFESNGRRWTQKVR